MHGPCEFSIGPDPRIVFQPTGQSVYEAGPHALGMAFHSFARGAIDYGSHFFGPVINAPIPDLQDFRTRSQYPPLNLVLLQAFFRHALPQPFEDVAVWHLLANGSF